MNSYAPQDAKVLEELYRHSEKKKRDTDPDVLQSYSQSLSDAINEQQANGINYFEYITESQFNYLVQKHVFQRKTLVDNKAAKINKDLVLVHEKEKLSGVEEFRSPLFYIKLPENVLWDNLRCISGIFRLNDEGRLCFVAKINDNTYIILPCYSYLEELTSTIVNLLCSRELYLTIIGEHCCGLFLVKGIHIFNGGSVQLTDAEVPLCLSDDFLQILIQTSTERFTVFRDFMSLPVDRTQLSIEELYYFYKVDLPSFPAELQGWIEKCFKEAFAAGSKRKESAKSQMLIALYYVLAIDWKIPLFEITEFVGKEDVLNFRLDGLQKAVEPILELAEQIQYTMKLPKQGILIEGPVDIDKNSIANAIAEMLDLPITFLEFSSICNCEILSGTPRTFSGGTPGLILGQMFATKTATLIIVLNGIDKAAEEIERSSMFDILLSILDKEGYIDNYIGVKIPTNGILFIATCEESNHIYQPILERFDRIVFR